MHARLAFLVAALVGACERSASDPWATTADAAADVQIPTSCGEMRGDAAFSARLSGTGQFVAVNGGGGPWPRERTVFIDVYFPRGRVPGGTVLLAMPSPANDVAVSVGQEVTLAADLSATGLGIHDSRAQVKAELLPGAGGLVADIEMNFAELSSDAVYYGMATIPLCPSPSAPEPKTRDLYWEVLPLDPITVDSAVPLSTATLASVAVTAGNGPVGVTVQPVPGRSSFRVIPVAAFPPGQRLVLDVSQVRDVLGRPIPVPVGMSGYPLLVPGTSAVLTDLTLSTAPASEAVACNGACSIKAGGITVGGSSILAYGPDELLLALPDATPTKLRARASMSGPSPDDTYCTTSADMAVVGQFGHRTELVNLTCASLVDYDLDLQSIPPPRWLVVRVTTIARQPYSMPPPPSSIVTLHNLQLL